ncbi:MULTISPECIES: DUF6883 domain-containing protein [Rhodoplanes]|uniref:DUF6883 domain-containing protein n=1 Tax=Rhodoplanes TaxID=29407 RepID=UPI003462DE0A
MAGLPHGDRAIVDLRKIEDYCLSPAHSRGRHKARVFRVRLGLQRDDSKWLRIFCSRPRTPGRRRRSPPMREGRSGASTSSSSDTKSVPW